MKINVFKMQILMGERGLTIKKLAELSGVSRQTISCIISGKDELSYSFGIQRTENVGTARSEDCHPKYVL